jgi:outer membrane immunogenic protein
MKKFFAVATIAAMIPVSMLAQAAGQHKNDETNWTGFYAGLNAGGAFGSSNARTGTVYSSTGYFQTTSVPVVNSVGNQNLSPVGYVGGAQFGYIRQISPKWVLGAEVDFGAFTTNDSASATAVYPCCSPYYFTVTQNVSTDWMSTVRARAGYAVSKHGLLFVSAGAAETKLNYSSLFTDDDIITTESASASVLKTGWTVGGGGEYALNKRWSARAEYLFADFGTVSNAGNVLTEYWNGSTYTYPTTVFTHTATLKSNTARLAVNYRF